MAVTLHFSIFMEANTGLGEAFRPPQAHFYVEIGFHTVENLAQPEQAPK